MFSFSPEISAFNFKPLSYLDRSWLESLESSEYFLKIGGATPTYREQSYVLACFDLADDYDFDFSNPAKSVALLSNRHLMRLLTVVGACFYLESCKKIIEKDALKALKNLLGEDGYRFVIFQVPFLLSNFPEAWQKTLPVGLAEDELRELFSHLGLSVFASLLENTPESFSKRLLLKLPKDMAEHYAKTDFIKTEDNPMIYRLIKKTCKQVMPECSHLLK